MALLSAPVTVLVIVICVARWAHIWAHATTDSAYSCNHRAVLVRAQFWRLFLAPVSHGSATHLAISLAVLLRAAGFEAAHGAAAAAQVLLLLALGTEVITLWLEGAAQSRLGQAGLPAHALGSTRRGLSPTAVGLLQAWSLTDGAGVSAFGAHVPYSIVSVVVIVILRIAVPREAPLLPHVVGLALAGFLGMWGTPPLTPFWAVAAAADCTLVASLQRRRSRRVQPATDDGAEGGDEERGSPPHVRVPPTRYIRADQALLAAGARGVSRQRTHTGPDTAPASPEGPLRRARQQGQGMSRSLLPAWAVRRAPRREAVASEVERTPLVGGGPGS